MKKLFVFCLVFTIFGCAGESAPEAESIVEPPPKIAEPDAEVANRPASLSEILNAQPDEVKARYPYRNPQETLEFFGIEPGMTLVEILPGGGWYTKLLIPYLGQSGHLIGADYPQAIWPNFSFMSPEALAERENWVEDWTAEAETWRKEGDANVSAFKMAELPEQMEGTADAVLFIRALHNLARFEGEISFLSEGVEEAFRVLKPGGVLGVVQHQARGDMPDTWANGNAGYLKPSFVIEQMEAAGFNYVGSSSANANTKDQPTEQDVVWRLPPTFATSKDDSDLQEAMREIGESNRMTLKFRKPQN